MKKIFRKFTLLLLLVPMLNSCELDPIERRFGGNGSFVLLSSAW